MATPAHGKLFNVLFLCTHNSARSVMAECLLNRHGMGKFKGYSAGSQPSGKLNPYVVDLLKRENFVVDELRSKNWDEFAAPGAPEMDFVFTVCDTAAAETCPVWPGQPMTAHWGLPDPSAATGTEAEIRATVADVYRMIDRRVSIFVNLPMASLGGLSLQTQLDQIGQQK
jgi:protein-tyrosine-phosphatase